MLLSVLPAEIDQPALTFTFTVPGHQIWTPRSFRATCSKDVGGSPLRVYNLFITDGTSTVAMVGAQDAGDEPGTCTVTWANAPGAASSSGNEGVSVAPLAPFQLNAGYVITGEILAPAPNDTWLDAVAWYDFIYTD